MVCHLPDCGRNLVWLGSRGVNVPALNSGVITTPWLGSIAGSFNSFVSDVLVRRFVPVAAASFVLKACLDAANGQSPLGSAIAAIFLRSVPSTIQLFESWNNGSMFATTDLLQSLWNSLAGKPQRAEAPDVVALDRLRVETLRKKEALGQFLRSIIHSYFLWDPAIHHRVNGKHTSRTPSFSLSAKKCVERSRREHRSWWRSLKACCGA